MKMYIAIREDFPDFMTPTLVAHAVIAAHIKFTERKIPEYQKWLSDSFKKVTVRVSRKEFDKIAQLPMVYGGREIHTCNGEITCIVVCPTEVVPNVLKYAKLWKPATKNTFDTL